MTDPRIWLAQIEDVKRAVAALHFITAPAESDEPCMCDTDFTCMATEHDEEA